MKRMIVCIPACTRSEDISLAKHKHSYPTMVFVFFFRDWVSLCKGTFFSEGTTKQNAICLFKEFPLKQYSKMHACLRLFMSKSVCTTTALGINNFCLYAAPWTTGGPETLRGGHREQLSGSCRLSGLHPQELLRISLLKTVVSFSRISSCLLSLTLEQTENKTFTKTG